MNRNCKFLILHPTSCCDSWNNSCNFSYDYLSYTISNDVFVGHPVVLAWVRFCMCPPFLLWIVNEIITSMTTETSKSDKPQKEEVNLLNYIITLLFHLNITDIVLAVAALPHRLHLDVGGGWLTIEPRSDLLLCLICLWLHFISYWSFNILDAPFKGLESNGNDTFFSKCLQHFIDYLGLKKAKPGFT